MRPVGDTGYIYHNSSHTIQKEEFKNSNWAVTGSDVIDGNLSILLSFTINTVFIIIYRHIFQISTIIFIFTVQLVIM